MIWGRITVSLVRGSAGEPLYFVAQIQDITPFKAAGAALRESEERFRRAFDHAPIGMSLVAEDGRFIQVNRALCDLVGYSEEELLGKTFHDITHPEDVANNLELFERLWAGEIDDYQLEKRYLRKDGGVIWIHLTGSIVRDADGPKNGIAQIVDITERRHLEMDRAIMLASEREYTRQLRALTEMRADLTAMIAHELRAPVAALRMMTFLLATGELSSQAEGEMFAAVKGEIEQLDRLINDVADATSAEREDFSVQLSPVPLRVLFETAATYARATLGDHPFTMSPALDVRVWCDAERISQVLCNLLDNAAKHTPSDTPVALRAHREDTRVRMEVVDQGPGLPAEDVALDLREVWARPPSCRAADAWGRLGPVSLPSDCRGAWIRPHGGVGARHRNGLRLRPGGGVVTESPIRLLLVDDHAAFRLPLGAILEREPDLMVVAQAGSLAEARAVLPEIAGRVDVALVDLQLPDGNGVEFVRDLRTANPGGQTIALTGDTSKLHHASVIEAGAAGIVGKSAQPSAIVDAIRRVHAGELAQPAQEIVALLRLASQERDRTRDVEAKLAQLTPREREVLALLAEGLDNAAIAERLFISPDTARAHVVKVLAKLQVESRLQAAIFAIQHGIGASR